MSFAQDSMLHTSFAGCCRMQVSHFARCCRMRALPAAGCHRMQRQILLVAGEKSGTDGLNAPALDTVSHLSRMFQISSCASFFVGVLHYPESI